MLKVFGVHLYNDNNLLKENLYNDTN